MAQQVSLLNRLRGKLFEICINELLSAVHFEDVETDGTYVFENNGLRYVNGRGAAHDADVLKTPPFQTPFLFPVRVIFECKAYGKPVGLPVVRNAFGMRVDLNELEIITIEQLTERQTQRRKPIFSAHNRYQYQVGIASLSGFTSQAIEFAFNSKIPLLQLNLIIPNISSMFEELQVLTEPEISRALENINIYWPDQNHNKVSQIIKAVNEVKAQYIIGLLDSGEMIFLKEEIPDIFDSYLRKVEVARPDAHACSIHFSIDNVEQWWLCLTYNGKDHNLQFTIPAQYLRRWLEKDLSAKSALDIKSEYFRKIQLFRSASITPITLRLSDSWLNASYDYVE